jgi:tripeptide aminopeptidase
MDNVTDTIVSSFRRIVENYKGMSSDDARPRLETDIQKDFSRTYIPDNHPVVLLAVKAAENLGRKMKIKTSGGGADANIFFEKGIMTGVLGTGMRDMHTVRESVCLDDMVRTTELLLEIIRVHAEG